MRRTALLLASMALAVLISVSAALATEVLDQANVPASEETGNTWYQLRPGRWDIAQSFTAGRTGELSTVSFLVGKVPSSLCGAAYPDIDLKIYRMDDSYFPQPENLSLVSSVTISQSQIPPIPKAECLRGDTPPWTNVALNPGIDVVKGEHYFLAFEHEPVDDAPSSYLLLAPGGYAGGNAYSRDSGDLSWRSNDGSNLMKDIAFRTYVDVPDADGDAVEDSEDRCPNEVGPAANNGCPIPDTDSDGIRDDVDQCDNDPGPVSNNGCPMDTVSPSGSLQIDDGARRTRTRAVTLDLIATDTTPSSGLDSMRLKNAGGSWTAWQPYVASKNWKLTRRAGKKTIYAQYRDAAGNVSARTSDSITYRP